VIYRFIPFVTTRHFLEFGASISKGWKTSNGEIGMRVFFLSSIWWQLCLDTYIEKEHFSKYPKKGDLGTYEGTK